MWNLLRFVAVLIAVALFLTLPIIFRDSVPDGLYDAWDGLVTPLRDLVNGFWWRYFHRLDQQPLFQLSTLLTQALLIAGALELIGWCWRHRTL